MRAHPLATQITERAAARKGNSQHGFTLIELIVYMMLFLIVVGMVATLTIQMMRIQRDVTVTAHQNQTQQVVFTEISRSIRNAAGVRVAGGGNVLVANTFVGDEEAIIGVTAGPSGNVNDPNNWTCRAWAYDSGSQTLFATTIPSVASAAASASASEVPSLVAGTGWRPVVADVSKGTGPQMFTIVPASPAAVTATVDGVGIISGNGSANATDEIWVSMLARTIELPEPRPSITFDTRVSLRSGAPGSGTCL